MIFLAVVVVSGDSGKVYLLILLSDDSISTYENKRGDIAVLFISLRA